MTTNHGIGLSLFVLGLILTGVAAPVATGILNRGNMPFDSMKVYKTMLIVGLLLMSVSPFIHG